MWSWQESIFRACRVTKLLKPYAKQLTKLTLGFVWNDYDLNPNCAWFYISPVLMYAFTANFHALLLCWTWNEGVSKKTHLCHHIALFSIGLFISWPLSLCTPSSDLEDPSEHRVYQAPWRGARERGHQPLLYICPGESRKISERFRTQPVTSAEWQETHRYFFTLETAWLGEKTLNKCSWLHVNHIKIIRFVVFNYWWVDLIFSFTLHRQLFNVWIHNENLIFVWVPIWPIGVTW